MKVQEFIDRYMKEYTRYKEDQWNYEDGCVLIGLQNIYEATGDRKYVDFIENYLKYFITEDGQILFYEKEKYNIDNINCGKILFFMYDLTGEEKYRKAIDVLMDQLHSHPRCKVGNFFHKKLYPDQIWLDGLYMAQPFYMEYETRYDNRAQYGDIISQFENVQKYLYDEKTGLNFHACDMEKKMFWANKETGCSANFWLRSMGWYLMALVDVMDKMDKQIYEQYRKLEDIYKKMLKGILQYQDPETGLFYQVIDHAEVENNYLETSGSAMVGYSIIKAVRMGILNEEKYAPIGLKIVEGLINTKLKEVDGKLQLTDICSVAGLGPDNNLRRDGSVEYYLSEPIVSDDAKGVGPFFMAYGQYLQLKKEMEG